jgi:thioredoxin reductase (NADPH)
LSPAGKSAAGADVDALVIGAGPVGLYSAYCAGFRGVSVGTMDSLSGVGGQVFALYSERLIYDVAGFPAVRGPDLVAALAEQAGQYEPVHALGEQAQRLESSGDELVVTASSCLRFRARFIVMTGVGARSRRGECRYSASSRTGRGVLHIAAG